MTADAPVLLPREHGAYGPLIVPLATAVGVAGVTAPALLLGASRHRHDAHDSGASVTTAAILIGVASF